MKSFSDIDLFLTTPTAARLYREHVAALPIIDVHSHLDVTAIAENRAITNLTELWLYGDRDKAELMRVCGVDEHFITGNASDFEKFRELCRVLPMLIGNKQYAACHTELCRYFNCELTINSDNCETIWRETSQRLANNRIGAYDYLKMSGAKAIFVTSSPIDDLKTFDTVKSRGEILIAPIFCPDRCFDIDKKGIRDYFAEIGKLTSVDICDYKSFCQAYTVLMDRFGAVGCKVAYHKIDTGYSFVKPDLHHAEIILKKALIGKGVEISRSELSLWQTQLLRFFGIEYAKRGWIMELEYRSYSHSEISAALTYLSSQNALPTVIIYSDDNRASEICRKLCHTKHNISTKVLQGIGFTDNLEDIATKTAIGSVLGFRSEAYGYNIGIMHELWRKEVCNLLGGWVDKGICPEDAAVEAIRAICYQNAATYLKTN